MTQITTRLLKAGLSALHYSGAATAARAIAPFTSGQGALFMLHHVRPHPGRRHRAPDHAFDPNRLLTITPHFLDRVVCHVRRAGFDIVSLDEAHRRLTTPDGSRRRQKPFACFTFDDGYRDNRDHALPVLKRHDVPFAVYVATDFADGRGFLWWLVLERVLRSQEQVSVVLGGTDRNFDCRSIRQKQAAFRQLYWWLRRLPEAEARGIVLALAHKARIDVHAPCRELVMTWPELRDLAADPLVTIGAHSVRHMALGRLDEAAARAEITDSVKRIETEIGKPCRHFCYPYGNPASAGEREFAIAAELGLHTAVTTAKGFVANGPETRLTALPRVSLNGDYQRVRYLSALLSGLPFALWRALDYPRLLGAGLVGAGSPVAGPVGAGSIRCIQLTSKAAGTTHASPPTT